MRSQDKRRSDFAEAATVKTIVLTVVQSVRIQEYAIGRKLASLTQEHFFWLPVLDGT
jgi:hypothetical protein